jgi:hypothetical protein
LDPQAALPALPDQPPALDLAKLRRAVAVELNTSMFQFLSNPASKAPTRVETFSLEGVGRAREALRVRRRKFPRRKRVSAAPGGSALSAKEHSENKQYADPQV